MDHLGDITKICGHDAPPVDVVVGGSPCQDLSVAGKREGFAGARSGLYMEQIRIIKELRDADKRRGRTGIAVRPRYMVWENVEGALSSPGRDRRGEDFRAAIEEAIRIAEPEAPDLFVPEKGWPGAGAVCDEQGGWSLAWRVLDAQHWGVPQRRKRICMVVDFAGATAPGILFPDAPDGGCTWGADADQAVGHSGAGPGSQIPSEPEGLPGDPEPGAEAGEGSAGAAESGAGGAICIHDMCTRFAGRRGNGKWDGKGNGLGIGQPGDPCFTLTAGDRHGVLDVTAFHLLQDPIPNDAVSPCLGQGNSDRGQASIGVVAGFLARQGAKVSGIGFEENKAPTLRGGQADAAVVYDARGNGDGYTAATMTGDHQNRVTDYTTICVEATSMTPWEGQARRVYDEGGVMASLSSREKSGQDQTSVLQKVTHGVDARNGTEQVELNGTLQAHSSGGYSLNCGQTIREGLVVRRLTPLECERLQGYPDGWTDIGDWIDSKGRARKTTDSARFKALGNSIALPQWKWLCKRLCGHYERDATMASLFDGIGGFPLIWEQLNGRGSCLWSSEIEEFPMAVTRYRFR